MGAAATAAGAIDAPVESHRYGGVASTLMARIDSPDVAKYVRSVVPPAAMNVTSSNAGSEFDPSLSFITAGELITGQERADFHEWVAKVEDDVAEVVRALGELVDGPLTRWVAARRDADHLIDAELARVEARADGSERALAVYALQNGRPDVADRVLAAARERPARDDTVERLDAFATVLRVHPPQAA